jgi:hypothetical protein
MYVISLDIQLADNPPVDVGRLPKQLLQADGHFAKQDSFPILWYPNEVILQSVFGVCA